MATIIMMTRATSIVVANRATSLLFSTGKRYLSSSTKLPKGVGVMKPRKPATAAAAAVTGGEAAESSLSSVSSMDELPWSVKRNNFLLASALFTFCVSVAWYSMNAVGQADNRSTSNNINDNSSDTAHDTDDPLAALRVEAQAAQDARGKQLEEAKEASAMLQQFDKGAFDPDRIDEEEEELLAEEEAAEEEKKKKNGKSSWWRWLKFW